MINDPLLRAIETDQLASNGIWIWITRCLYLVTILSAAFLSIWGFLRHKGLLHGKLVWIAVLIYACGPIVASVFGAVPGVYPEVLLFPLVSTAFYLNGDLDGEVLYVQMKVILLLFIFGSILAMLVNPLWAIQFPYLTGIFPIPIRLFGLAESPQRMGPMLLLFVILERLTPTSGWKKYLNWTAWGAVLILAQEKVALLSLLVFMGLFCIEPARAHLRRNPRTIQIIGMAFLLVALIGAVFVAADPSSVQGLSERGQDIGIDTLTGRTGIWKVTLTTWQENPIFGYGPHLWDLSYRLKAGPQFMHVGMAHNQFVQSLGEAGLFGFLCLLIALFLLLYYAFKRSASTRWISVALVLIVVLPTMTEAPLRNYFLGEDFFTFLCLVTLLFHSNRFSSHLGLKTDE